MCPAFLPAVCSIACDDLSCRGDRGRRRWPEKTSGDIPMAERHEMILNGCEESGAEEWVCPDCGRRMLMRWLPEYEVLMLEHGDDRAIHVGSKGLSVNNVVVAPAPTCDALS